MEVLWLKEHPICIIKEAKPVFLLFKRQNQRTIDPKFMWRRVRPTSEPARALRSIQAEMREPCFLTCFTLSPSVTQKGIFWLGLLCLHSGLWVLRWFSGTFKLASRCQDVPLNEEALLVPQELSVGLCFCWTCWQLKSKR